MINKLSKFSNISRPHTEFGVENSAAKISWKVRGKTANGIISSSCHIPCPHNKNLNLECWQRTRMSFLPHWNLTSISLWWSPAWARLTCLRTMSLVSWGTLRSGHGTSEFHTSLDNIWYWSKPLSTDYMEKFKMSSSHISRTSAAAFCLWFASQPIRIYSWYTLF